jgi:uncharacterized protein (DUF983 family)
MTERAALPMIGRALRLRCPNCGNGPLFQRWIRMVPKCDRCGLVFDRGEQGYLVGAYLFNFAVAEMAWLALMVTWAAVTWPSPPWGALLWIGVSLMVLMPVLFYPFSKTLFLAIDLIVRPRGTE